MLKALITSFFVSGIAFSAQAQSLESPSKPKLQHADYQVESSSSALNRTHPVLLRNGSGNATVIGLVKAALQDDPPVPSPTDGYWNCVYECDADADLDAFMYCNNMSYDQQFYCEESYKQQAQDCQSHCRYPDG